ncbi:hypothetical protein Cgig2_017927 [Carnegiea gigantea]|uniref:Amino acid transporter transmembrane domain-containing protein n=1 Tax=Carnegiea gigantea TaxID=171969 RepID=A0A9Q1K9Z8_9CARY|nr:hypothetical protein Cgig2_017927 [Carnegiea gigantea]
MEEVRRSLLDSNPESPQAMEHEAKGSNEDKLIQGSASTKPIGPTRQSKPRIGLLSVLHALASGGWVSFILLFLIAMTASLSRILVKRCLEVSPNIKSYVHIGEHAYGKVGRVVISVIRYIELYMVPIGFLILEGDTLYNLFSGFHIHGMGLVSGKKGFVTIVSLLLIPSHPRLCCNGYLWLFDVCIKYESPNHTKPSNRAKKLTSGNIHHHDHSLGKICTNGEADCEDHKAFRLLIRTAFVASQMVMALAFPFYGYLMSLRGALLCANISLTIPCVCYWKIKGTRWEVEVIVIVGIIIFGALIVTLGTYSSLVEIIDAIKGSTN